jgi:hypothetical protein
MLNLEPIKARLTTAAHIWLWWWDEASEKYAISTDAGNNVSLWAERREDAAEVCKNHKTLLELIEEVELLREHAELRKAQIRAYEKALTWYALPENWKEQVDDRGRETLRFRWADDDGHMARHALSVWRQSNGEKKA